MPFLIANIASILGALPREMPMLVAPIALTRVGLPCASNSLSPRICLVGASLAMHQPCKIHCGRRAGSTLLATSTITSICICFRPRTRKSGQKFRTKLARVSRRLCFSLRLLVRVGRSSWTLLRLFGCLLIFFAVLLHLRAADVPAHFSSCAADSFCFGTPSKAAPFTRTLSAVGGGT